MVAGLSEILEADRRREKRNAFLTFGLFSVFLVGYLFYEPLTFTKLRDWIILGGAVIFPVCALLSYRSMRGNWTVEKKDRVFTRTFGLTFLGPVVAVVAGIALYAVPSWAAAIVVLLALILLK